MPNIGTVLREEISRLALRTSRGQINPTKKSTAQHRRAIALLKRQLAQLERQVTLLTRKVLGTPPALPSDATAKHVRFAAKGLRAQRKRLGLSAADFAKLVGVSPQSIYNWEQEASRPREKQIAKLVALRALGKREARERVKGKVGANASARRRP